MPTGNVIRRIPPLVLLLVLCVCARAQDISEIAGPFGLPISGATFERINTSLGLDQEQKQFARQLYQGYRGALRQTMADTNKSLQNMQEVEPADRANRGIIVLDEFADKHEAVERGFFEDLKVVLRPDQLPALESVLRARRREVQMRFAFIAGEGVDLVRVLEHVGATPAPGTEAAGFVQEYEETMDRLLLEKQKLLRASLKRAFKIQKEGLPDFELIASIVSDLYALGARIRDTNRRFIRLIEPVLSEGVRAELTQEVRQLSYPKVYARTLPMGMLKEAGSIPGLTAEQRDEISSIEAAYLRDLEAANQRYAAAIDSTQERFPKEFLAVMQLRNSTSPDDPLVKARLEREELNQRVFSKLRALLKAEDFGRLPQVETERDNFPEFLPNMRVKKELGEAAGEPEEPAAPAFDPKRSVEPR